MHWHVIAYGVPLTARLPAATSVRLRFCPVPGTKTQYIEDAQIEVQWKRVAMPGRRMRRSCAGSLVQCSKQSGTGVCLYGALSIGAVFCQSTGNEPTLFSVNLPQPQFPAGTYTRSLLSST